MGSSSRGASRVLVERLTTGSAPDAVRDERMMRCREIRHRVFVEEQSVPPDLEWDGLDDDAEHFAALEITQTGKPDQPREEIVGTARLRTIEDHAKAERVAVLATHRQRGVGRSLMEALEQRAIECGLRQIELNAQVGVVPFYERLGYTPYGEVFVEAGIEHLAMSKRLR